MNIKFIDYVLGLTMFFGFISLSIAQEQKILSPKKLLKDFESLVDLIEAHPDPYTNVNEALFNKSLEELKQSLSAPHSELDFFRKVTKQIALINDGHSSSRLPARWMKKVRKKRGCLPYKMYLTNDDKLFIIDSYNKDQIPKGTEITKINGIGVDSFLNRVDPYVSYELKPFRNTIIDNAFEMFLFYTFGLEDIVFSYNDTESKVENIPYKVWKKWVKKTRKERELKIAIGQPYVYEDLGNGVGIIKLFSFSSDRLISYIFFLEESFKSMKKNGIHTLIIDVRGNYGGWPKISSYLFNYISEGYFKTMAKSEMKVSYAYRNYFYDQFPKLRTKRPYIGKRLHFLDLNSILYDKVGTIVSEAAYYNEKPETKKYEFKGDCYLLTNRDSYSAASSFASTFQCYSMGYIIGEETGGTKIFRANSISDVLPKSGLAVRMSTTKLFTPCYGKELESVKPHIAYTPSIFDVMSGMDTHLLFAQRIIKKARKMKFENN